MMESQDISHWIERAKAGDSEASRQLWHHYFDRLVRTVRQNLRGQNRAIRDEEDIVASVFESFYRAAEEGRFPELAGRDGLWRLLLRMSARKVIDKRRHDQRKRRGAGASVRSLQDAGDDQGIIEVIGTEPSPDMIVMMTESVERMLQHLGDGQLRQIAAGKLEGYSNAELAHELGCSERTIERRLHLIREKCEQELLNENEPSS